MFLQGIWLIGHVIEQFSIGNGDFIGDLPLKMMMFP
jgi:hypothetical protein